MSPETQAINKQVYASIEKPLKTSLICRLAATTMGHTAIAAMLMGMERWRWRGWQSKTGNKYRTWLDDRQLFCSTINGLFRAAIHTTSSHSEARESEWDGARFPKDQKLSCSTIDSTHKEQPNQLSSARVRSSRPNQTGPDQTLCRLRVEARVETDKITAAALITE